MTATPTIEMAPFELVDDLPVEQLLVASERLEREFLSALDGYLGRMLVRKDDKSWADIVFWRSAAQAAEAMKLAATSEVCRAYFACMAATDHDDPSHGVTHFQTVKTYGSVAL
jgi:hypothetical protein